MSDLLTLLLLGLGAWMFVSPRSALEFKAGLTKSLGAKLTWTKKTESFYRFLGATLAALGLLMLLGVVY